MTPEQLKEYRQYPLPELSQDIKDILIANPHIKSWKIAGISTEYFGRNVITQEKISHTTIQKLEEWVKKQTI